MSPTTHIQAPDLPALREALTARSVRRVLLICGPTRRFVPEVQAALRGFEVEIFDAARTHVPVEIVARAREVATRFAPDALLSVGGGAATGLAKALRLERDVAFFAVPTTYAGSEMTSIYGVTENGEKRTGRDPKARPNAVFYVAEFVAGLPRHFETTSLLNALAHPISALAEGGLADEDQALALDAVRQLVEAALQLAQTPTSMRAKSAAQRAASLAAQVLDRGRMGAHHRLVHALGGRFALAHDAMHAAVLPHSLAALRADAPELYARIEAAAGLPDLPAQLFDLLRRVGAKTALGDMDLAEAALQDMLQAAPELPRAVAQAALHGRRPAKDVRREDWGLRHSVSLAGPPLARAKTVIVAVHGRGSAADAILRLSKEIVGHPEGLCIVAPQAPDRRWYDSGYREAPEACVGALDTALWELDEIYGRVREAAPGARVVLFGFSQGACLAAEWVARRAPRIEGLVALSGARLGTPESLGAPAKLSGLSVLLGVAAEDAWVKASDVDATAAWFAASGAEVTRVHEAGGAHTASTRQRLAARDRLLGRGPQEGLRGFGNVHESEALPGALPLRQNSPQRVRYGLYAEQINGTGFVAARHTNHRSWLYRVRPSAQHGRFEPLAHPHFPGALVPEGAEPNLIGHRPLPLPEAPTDFVDGLATYGGAGAPQLRRGFAVHLYAANRSMESRTLYNSDGDLLIVPEHGGIDLRTELGTLTVEPGKIVIVPRGIKFSVLLRDGTARGYVAEVYGRHFELPERGPVGANGLTEARHFLAPSAAYEDRLQPGFRVTNRFSGKLFEATQDYSPYDVVAWHGNYSPYVYDLMDFGPVSNVRFDHPDPSIYTVLSAAMDELGAHTLDFVFFPPRWDSTEHTFRPPFFHRNATTEFNGIIRNPARPDSMFPAGLSFLTPAMTAHGVLAGAVQQAFLRKTPEPPVRTTERSMWFQFETALPFTLTRWALDAPHRIADWHERWGTYRTHFDPTEPK